MSKTKMTSLFCTGNTIHSDVLDVQNLPQKSKKQSTPPISIALITKDDLAMFIKAEVWAQGTGCKEKWTADLNDIDTSLITDMSGLFSNNVNKGYGLQAFNGSIDEWDVSSVINMHGMFYGATTFNQDLNEWYEHLKNTDDTYRKVNTQDMFRGSPMAGAPKTPAWLAKIPK